MTSVKKRFLKLMIGTAVHRKQNVYLLWGVILCCCCNFRQTNDERAQGVTSTLKFMQAHHKSSSLSKMTPNEANMNSYILRSLYGLKRFNKGFVLRVLLHTLSHRVSKSFKNWKCKSLYIKIIQ